MISVHIDLHRLMYRNFVVCESASSADSLARGSRLLNLKFPVNDVVQLWTTLYGDLPERLWWERKASLSTDTADLENFTHTKQSWSCEMPDAKVAKESLSKDLKPLAKATTMISEKKCGVESFSCSLTRTSVLRLSSSALSLRREGTTNLYTIVTVGVTFCYRHLRALRPQTEHNVMGSIRDIIPRPEENVLVHKAHCDTELSECRTKEAKLAELKKRPFLIGTKSFESAQHERDVASLQISLGELCYLGETSRRGRGRHRRRSHRAWNFA